MARTPDGTLLGQWEVNRKIIGAGGFVFGGGQSLDGTRVANCDSTGPHYLRPGEIEWQPFLRVGEEPWCNYNGSTVGLITDIGAAIQVARTDSSIMGALVSNALFRTTDGGETVQRTTFQRNYISADSNGTHFRIDPANPAHWWLGAPEGIYVSDDMFETYTLIDTSALPGPDPAITARFLNHQSIVFDEASAVVGGKTQGVYVNVPGQGVYHTTNAGTTWTQIDSGEVRPTRVFARLTVDDQGTLHLCQTGSAGYKYWRWDGEDWTDTGQTGVMIVADPHTPGRLLLPNEASMLRISQDYGATWAHPGSNLQTIAFRKSRRIPWLEFTNEWYMSFGDLYFDLQVPNRIWLMEGVGIWYADDIPAQQTDATPITWHECSVGIENMTMTAAMMTEHGTALLPFWDRVGMAIPREEIGRKFPRTNAPTAVDRIAINKGHGMDCAPEDPNYIVCTSISYGHSLPESSEVGGYSENNGGSWKRNAGDIAYFAQGRHIWLTGSISGATLTVDSIDNVDLGGENIEVGMVFTSNPYGVTIAALGTGTGGVGTYTLSQSVDAYSGPMHLVDLLQAGSGNIAVLSKQVCIQLQVNNGKIMYSLDERHTWHDLGPFFGEGFTTGTSFGTSYLERKTLVRDWYNPNTAYFYCLGSTTWRGIWKIVYNGDETFTCTRQCSTYIGRFGHGDDYWNGKLVQYADGHWLWTAGPDKSWLYESRDDCQTWTPVTGSDDINGNFGGYPGGYFGAVYGVSVGAPALPGEPKTVTVVGHRPPNAVSAANPVVNELYHTYFGLWECRNFTDPDADRLWTRLSKFPGSRLGGYYGRHSDIISCPIEYGKHIIPSGSGGAFMVKLTDRRRARAA
jgi:hypothetical protein